MSDADHVLSVGLPDGRQAQVFPIMFGRARLGVGQPGDRGYQDVW